MITTLLNGVPMPVLWLEDGFHVTAANSAAQAFFGEKIDGRRLTDLLRHPDFYRALDDALADGQRRTLPLALPGRGDTVRFEVHITPTGQGRGAVIALEDQTAIEQASAMRKGFVANVSHELRTPLTALVGFIETLRGAAREDATARDRFLGIMEREAERMIRLVNDLLSLSRVEADEYRRPTSRVDIATILRNVLATQADQAKAAGVKISMAGADAGLMVRGDADQLMQVFHNLCENGIKYGGAGGLLSITLARVERDARLKGPALAIEVADRGEGIDPLHLPRLTERFYRIDDHRSREKGGTGLGLAIVKHIVNRHRGRLKIDSEPGKGSKFTVILPLD
ncbi:MAG: ATP-binding protein [Paracoccaceae bacterium]